MKIVTVNKAFDYSPSENHGIFYYMQNLANENVPWKQLNIADRLDYYYHLNHSGNKIVSPLIDSFLYNDEIPSENLPDIAKIIVSLYGKTWERLWEVYNSEYNPISNYSMEESETETTELNYGKSETQTNNTSKLRTDNLTQTRTDDLTQTETPNITNQETLNLSETQSPAESITRNESIYGFNSSSASPSNSYTETHSGTNGKTNTGTDTTVTSGTDTTTNTGTQATASTGTQTIADTGTITNAQSGKDIHGKQRVLTRDGNIGVTTTQEMIQSEIDLWTWNYFINCVIPNIDGVLTISLY